MFPFPPCVHGVKSVSIPPFSYPDTLLIMPKSQPKKAVKKPAPKVKASKPASKAVAKAKAAKVPKPAKASKPVKAAKASKVAATPVNNVNHARPVPRKPVKLTPFLKQQKQRLMALRDTILDSMAGVAKDTLRSRPEGSEASAFGMHQADAGSDAYDKDFALSLLSQEQDALYEIEEALKRVDAGTKRPLRIWLDIGTAESTPSASGQRLWLDHARLLRDALQSNGWREGQDLHYEEVEGAPHNERAWAARIDRILEYLLAKP